MKKNYRVDYFWYNRQMLEGEEPYNEQYDTEIVEGCADEANAMDNFVSATYDNTLDNIEWICRFNNCEPTDVDIDTDYDEKTVTVKVRDTAILQCYVWRARPEDDEE